MEFKRERLQDILEEFKEVLQFNYEQTASHQDKFELDVDWNLYFTMENMGFLHITTLRDNGKLIGYMSFSVPPNLNFKTEKFAYPDKYVILKEYWGHGYGRKLVQKTIEWATELGCSKIFGGVRIDQGYAPLYMYLSEGYEKVEITLEKVL